MAQQQNKSYLVQANLRPDPETMATDMPSYTPSSSRHSSHSSPSNRTKSIDEDDSDERCSYEQESVESQKEREAENDIRYRTCGWVKATALLFGEYVGIAIMSFGWAYSVLGIVPALMITVAIAILVMYISYVIWEFCIRHPKIQNVCDVTSVLFKGNKWIWWFTAIMYIAENTVIQALHCLVGVDFLNSISSQRECTIMFAGVIVIISWIASFSRTFNGLSKLATVVTASTIISVFLMIIFATVQGNPPSWPIHGEVLEILILPKPGTSLRLAMNATLNILYAFLTQMAVPAIVADMKEPRDFPKVLWVATICQIVLFATCGIVVYVYIGGNYITSPSFGSLERTFEIITYCFMFPAIIYMGIFHCSMSARLIHCEIFRGTRHLTHHTVVGWLSWIGILGTLWICAFILYEVVPFFDELMSLITSLFEPYFGFFLWAKAYFHMRYYDHGKRFWRQNWRSSAVAALNAAMMPFGVFLLVCGTYVSIESIIDQYKTNAVNRAFSCASGFA